jgi:hypothetical protein
LLRPVHRLLSRQEQVVQGVMGEEPPSLSEHIVSKAKRTLELPLSNNMTFSQCYEQRRDISAVRATISLHLRCKVMLPSISHVSGGRLGQVYIDLRIRTQQPRLVQRSLPYHSPALCPIIWRMQLPWAGQQTSSRCYLSVRPRTVKSLATCPWVSACASFGA